MGRQLTAEEKIRAVKSLETRSYSDVSEEFDVSAGTLSRWKKLYEAEGIEGLGRKQYDAPPKIDKRVKKIVAARRDGQTLAEIAKTFKLSRERIRQIILASGEDVPSPPRGVRPGQGYKSTFPQKIIDKALAMYETKSVKEISADLGISTYTISKWAKEADLPPKRTPEFSDKVKADSLEMYKTHPSKDVIKKFGIPQACLTRWAREAGISKTRRLPEKTKRAAVAMYETHTATEVCEKFNCSPGSLWTWRKEYGGDTKKSKTGRSILTDEEKAEIVELTKTKSNAEVAEKFDISETTVRRCLATAKG